MGVLDRVVIVERQGAVLRVNLGRFIVIRAVPKFLSEYLLQKTFNCYVCLYRCVASNWLNARCCPWRG